MNELSHNKMPTTGMSDEDFGKVDSESKDEKMKDKRRYFNLNQN